MSLLFVVIRRIDTLFNTMNKNKNNCRTRSQLCPTHNSVRGHVRSS